MFQKKFNNLDKNLKSKLLLLLSLLEQGKPLPISAKDHKLKGNYEDFREFHLKGDLLVLYKYAEEENTIYVLRLGSRSELFENIWLT